eukprot:scaffold1204_cov313-Pavlova_lutheri.AAC.10
MEGDPRPFDRGGTGWGRIRWTNPSIHPVPVRQGNLVPWPHNRTIQACCSSSSSSFEGCVPMVDRGEGMASEEDRCRIVDEGQAMQAIYGEKCKRGSGGWDWEVRRMVEDEKDAPLRYDGIQT